MLHEKRELGQYCRLGGNSVCPKALCRLQVRTSARTSKWWTYDKSPRKRPAVVLTPSHHVRHSGGQMSRFRWPAGASNDRPIFRTTTVGWANGTDQKKFVGEQAGRVKGGERERESKDKLARMSFCRSSRDANEPLRRINKTNGLLLLIDATPSVQVAKGTTTSLKRNGGNGDEPRSRQKRRKLRLSNGSAVLFRL